MRTFVFYDSYGKITKVHNGNNDWSEENKQPDESVLEAFQYVTADGWYVANNILVPTVPFPDVTVTELPVINSTIAVSNLPDDTLVFWPDEVETRESGSFTFSTDVGGSFGFMFYHARHPMKRLIINVT